MIDYWLISDKEPAKEETETLLIGSGVLVGLLLLLVVVYAVHKYFQDKICCPIMKEDVNDIYGDYSDPDPVVEVTDSNPYYTCDYGDGTTMTRDNNSLYGF